MDLIFIYSLAYTNWTFVTPSIGYSKLSLLDYVTTVWRMGVWYTLMADITSLHDYLGERIGRGNSRDQLLLGPLLPVPSENDP